MTLLTGMMLAPVVLGPIIWVGALVIISLIIAAQTLR